MAAEIDTLQIKIQANAKSAADSLKSLAGALDKVKTSLHGMKNRLPEVDGLSKASTNVSKASDNVSKASATISKSVTEINRALESISLNGMARMEELTKTLNSCSKAINDFKSVGTISTKIRQAEKAMSLSPNASTGSGLAIKGGDTAVSGGEESEGDIKQNTKDWLKWYSAMEQESKKAGEQVEKTTGLFGKFKSALSSIKNKSNALAQVGRDAKNTTGILKRLTETVGGFIKSIGRIALYRAIRSMLKDIAGAFEEGLKNAYYYSKQTGDLSNLARALDNVKSKTAQMTNQIGAFWGEIKQLLAPALEWIAKQITKITEYLTELFAALNGDDYYQRAKLVAQSWDDAADAVEKYKHQLLGVDELNNLSAKNQTANDKTLAAAKEAFEDVAVRPELKAIGQTWQNVKQTIVDAFDSIRKELLAPAATAALGAIFLFTGHPILGVGMIISGMKWASDKIKMDNELLKDVQGYFKEYEDLFDFATAATIALGIMMLFIPGKTLLGLGILISSIAFRSFVKDPVDGLDWNGLLNDISNKFDDYRDLFSQMGSAAVAIGAILLFVPGMFGIGLGLILAGTVVKTLAEAKEFTWDELLKTIKDKFKKYKKMFGKLAAPAVAIGTILLFIPGLRGIGLGLILAGTTVKTLAEKKNAKWDELLGTITEKFQNIMDIFVVGSVAAAAVGVILLFVPGLRGVGLGLIKAALPGLFVGGMKIDWSGFLNDLKTWWGKIVDWFESNVLATVNKWVNIIEKSLEIDINGDGKHGGLSTNYNYKYEDTFSEFQRKTQELGLDNITINYEVPEEFKPQLSIDYSKYTPDLQKEAEVVGGIATGSASILNDTGILGLLEGDTNLSKFMPKLKASGGIVSRGSLFYAGEQGAEFVGSMGNTSAVANTEQMTDAIYKAAYMGMSKALAESNGFAGYEPATGDDVFLFLRKKANAFNKATGTSAFA